MEIKAFDPRRNIVIPGDRTNTYRFCADHFVQTANQAISDHSFFSVALSGGSTPKAIFELLSSPEYRNQVNWSKCWIFWSDERAVGPDEAESNYHMAMQAGLSSLPILKENIFRMTAEKEIELNAERYEQLIRDRLPGASFDLVMLGMGSDGHTASLFPKTHGLHSGERLVIPNFIPSLETWRMSLTFDCINAAKKVVVYILGLDKASIVAKVMKGLWLPDEYPIQRVGTAEHPALLILDIDAASALASD